MNCPEIITDNLMGIDVENNLYPGVASKGGDWYTHSSGDIAFDSSTLNGYPVIKAVGSWKSTLYKIFDGAVSGKTYTFEAMVKAENASDIRMYIVTSSLVGAATFSQPSIQFTNVPNNTWTKIKASFVCTASGKVSPTIVSGVNTTLYVSQYRFIEGTNVFSLKTALAEKAKNTDLQGVSLTVQDHTSKINQLNLDTGINYYSLGTETQDPYVGTNWNIIVQKNFKAGTKLKVKFNSYSGEYLSACSFGYIDSNNDYKTLKSNMPLNDEATATIPIDVTKIYFQFKRTQSEWSVDGCVSAQEDNNHIYYCKKDGTGDFKKLIDAINGACNFMDSVIYIGPGTWDLIDELGSEYINSVGNSQRGVYLKNRVHLIGSSESIITCHYEGSRADTITWLSAFNSGEYGFTLENIILSSSKCRYAIHDERDTATDAYANKYINCKITHNNENGGNAACIGGGLGKDGYVVIDGCIFENPNVNNASIVSYHNTWYSGGTGKSLVDIKNNYFRGVTGLRLAWFGASQEITTYMAHGNSFGKAIAYVVENQQMMDEHPEWIVNTELLAWDNEVRSN